MEAFELKVCSLPCFVVVPCLCGELYFAAAFCRRIWTRIGSLL